MGCPPSFSHPSLQLVSHREREEVWFCSVGRILKVWMVWFHVTAVSGWKTLETLVLINPREWPFIKPIYRGLECRIFPERKWCGFKIPPQRGANSHETPMNGLEQDARLNRWAEGTQVLLTHVFIHSLIYTHCAHFIFLNLKIDQELGNPYFPGSSFRFLGGQRNTHIYMQGGPLLDT